MQIVEERKDGVPALHHLTMLSNWMTMLKRSCWDELAELALNHVRHAGAEYGDIRIQHIDTRIIRGENRRLANIQDVRGTGFGVRVLYDGA